MLADDNNLFFTHKDIRHLLHIVSQELEKINQWLISNKLSLSIKKNIHFSKKKTLVNSYEIQRTESISF